MPVTTLRLWVVAVVALTEASNSMGGPSSHCTSTCSTQNDVVCDIMRLPYPCLMPDLDGVDHPNKPRNLTSVVHSFNSTRVVKLGWLLPKGFSYRAVKGFWMEVNTLHIGHQCYLFNLSTVNWSKVEDIQNVHFTHCLTYNTSQARTIFINLYSLPKATVDVEMEKLHLTLPAMTEPWNPNISAIPDHENLTVSFGPWLKGATYVRGCLAEVQKDLPASHCIKQIRFKNKTTHSWFHNVPCNKTYRVLIRSYVTNHARSRPISDWVKDTHILDMPCLDTPEPTTAMTQLVMQPPANLDIVPVILFSLLLLCLLVVSLVIIWFRRKAIVKVMVNLGCCKNPKPPSQDQVGNNECNVRVFPIYFPENTTYENAVIAHIHLLHQKYGINIETYDDQRPIIRQDMHEWVNENLKNNTVLIYYSKTVADFKAGKKMPEDYRTFGSICHYAMQKLKKLELAGQAVEPIHVTFDSLKTSKEYGVEDIISVVKEENDNIYMDNFDTIVYKLSGGEVQNFEVPNEAETRDLRIYISKLYDMEFLDDDDGLDTVSDFPEQEPMMPRNMPHPFHKSEEMGSTDSLRGSELPCQGQCHHHGDMFVNPVHCQVPCNQMPYSPLTGGVHSFSSGYNSGNTGRCYSGEYDQLQGQGLISRPVSHKHVCNDWECGHLPLDVHKTGCYGQEVDRNAPDDSESTYTLELDHLGHQPRMLNFIAPEIPASMASLSHIQEEFNQVNQTSGF